MFPLFNLWILENIIVKIESIVEQRLAEEDLNACYLVDTVHSGTKVQIFIDSDEGVSFGECQKLSRYIESVLDETLILGEKYVLEVSSPGIERPLKFLRQYPKNIGREIKSKLKDGSVIKGVLKEVKEEVLFIESEGKNKKESIINEITFDAVDSSKILISFGKQKMKK